MFLRFGAALSPVECSAACCSNDCLPAQTQAQGGSEYKKNVSSQYRFHLAFENIPLDDYVTEKFFQPLTYSTRARSLSTGVARSRIRLALSADSLMVYWGAPNIHDYAPGEKSFISAMDFKSPKSVTCLLSVLLDAFGDRVLITLTCRELAAFLTDRKSTRLNSSHT